MSGANPVQHEWMTLSVRPTSWWRHWKVLRHLPFFVGSRPRFSVTMTVPAAQAVEKSKPALDHPNTTSEWGQVQWGIQNVANHAHLFSFRHEKTGVEGVTAVTVGVRSGTPPVLTDEGTIVGEVGIRHPYDTEQVIWQPLVSNRPYAVIVRLAMLPKSGETVFEIANQAAYVFETWTREGLFVKAILPAIAFLAAVGLGYLNLAESTRWWPFGSTGWWPFD